MSDLDDLAADTALARAIAREASALLQQIVRDTNCSPAERGKRGDREANALILDRLRAARPDDRILSEESADDGARCSARRVWIIDPLDGTREFCEGLADYAVHIGLAIDGEARVGAVALPATGTMFCSEQRASLAEPFGGRPRIAVSRTRAPAIATQVAKALDATLVPMGSAGFKAMAVIAGKADIYLHDGGQYQWDNCAPVAVAAAAGLHTSRIDGAPLVYNGVDPSLPDLLICRREWAAPVLAAVAAAA